MTDFLVHWLTETWQVLLEAGPYLVLGFLLAGLIHAFVPLDKVTRHLGRPGMEGVFKAALIGAPLPLCSCSVVPVATAIRRQGASKGATASFLISTPETGVDSIAVTYGLLGPLMAVVRPIAAVTTAMVSGWAIERWDADRGGVAVGAAAVGTHAAGRAETEPRASGPSAGNCCHTPTGSPANAAGCCAGKENSASSKQGSSLYHRLAVAVSYGYGRMFEDLAHWLILGFILAGLVGAIVPDDFLDRHLGSGLVPMLLMLVVGLPLYVCATASTPVAAALIAKGLSPGAALVFLLVGPATNAATMLIVGKELGRRSLVIYLAGIAFTALLFGISLDALMVSVPALQEAVCPHGAEEATGLSAAAAGLLAVLMANGLRRRVVQWHHARHRPAAPASRSPVTVTLSINRRPTTS